jgi:hypothetical protein
MGHSIRGFVARPETLQLLCARFPLAKVVPLDAGVALVPGTRMAGALDFLSDHPAMARLLADLSRSGPIACVETDHSGGRGAQAATAYVDGKVVASKEGDGMPIDEALRAIGVVRNADEDEFDTVCLGTHRSMARFE